MFLGDGSFANKYQIAVSFNHRCEDDYAEYICKLVLRLFGLDSRIRVRKQYGSAEVVVNSVALVDYLRELVEIRGGGKKKDFRLPPWLMRGRRCKIGFVRGLFDSEGCVYKHTYYSNGKCYSYIKIAVTNYCGRILDAFQGALQSLGIESVRYQNRVHIYSAQDAKKFFRLIGSNNSKNKIRFRKFSH